MKKRSLSLQPSEAVVVHAASRIYAAAIASGRVKEGQEDEWIRRSINDAFRIAHLADEAIQSDNEMS
ncbi:MAG: hypothetical protein KDA79_23005 [Planctomycetaceae bacterium]|nr:hypothetical protein [Planctomycetaceae bacterium]